MDAAQQRFARRRPQNLSLPQLNRDDAVSAHVQRAEEIGAVTRSAFVRRDSTTLDKARQYATDLGLPTEAEEATRLLSQTEAQQVLAAAIHKRNPARLRAAINRAQMCNLNSRDLESAQRLLAHDEATLQMKQAMANKDADKLEHALNRAKAIGIERASLDKAVRTLSLLRAREPPTRKAAPRDRFSRREHEALPPLSPTSPTSPQFSRMFTRSISGSALDQTRPSSRWREIAR
eukprot:TRINITY_DN123837_c0_g1_i1.p1 TRINITY_DN123837_c0_g1~~TRINITY_DN123837_c0_g1_i1.p1  ORF type:complete len:234 (+),score=47.95 TRINITY_DN123837_c0_g1_i1:90-791(+)